MSDTTVLDKNPIGPTAVVGPTQPQNPVGTLGGKERGQMVTTSKLNLAGTEVRHSIDQQSAELGVREIQDRPDLGPEHIESGVRHSGAFNPFQTTPSNSIQYPMSEEEIGKQLKTGQDDDSGKWLAGLIQKVIKAMGL